MAHGRSQLTVGIDNQDARDNNDGQTTLTRTYAWQYNKRTTASLVNPTDSASARPGGNGYYVERDGTGAAASVRSSNARNTSKTPGR